MSLVHEVLGQDAIGAYLHGSSVLGGLRPGSDIDVLVLARRGTTPEEKRAFIDRLLVLSGHGDGSGRTRPIELTIVTESQVRPWRYPPSFDFQYGDWLRAEFERGDLAPWTTPNPDLAPLITMVRLGNSPLFGPPAADVLDPVPPGDLTRAIVSGIPDLLDDLESDTGNVILTLARIWYTVATGIVGSKDAAAEWVLDRLPDEHRAVLARARAIYLGDEEERWDDMVPLVRPHVDHVVREIAHVFEGTATDAYPG